MNTLRRWMSFTGSIALVLLTAFALVSGSMTVSHHAAHTTPIAKSTPNITTGSNTLPTELVPPVARTLAARSPATWNAHITKQTLAFNNPTQHLIASFNRNGVQLEFSGKPQAQLGMQLLAMHSGKINYAVTPAKLSAKYNRVDLVHGHGLTEWYVNSPLGVEQGFTLTQPPAPTRSLSLVFKLAGTLTAKLAGNSIEFRNPKGQNLLRYGNLLAYDADHHVLPAYMALTGQKLDLAIDTRGANYPITIDPLFAAVTSFAEPTPTAYNGLGYSVALSSDSNTALIGVPGLVHLKNGVPVFTTAGTAYVFSRTNGSWSTTPAASFADPANTIGDHFGSNVALSSDGHIALVGAESTADGSGGIGAAYLYAQNNGVWPVTPTHAFIDPGTGRDDFGVSVAVSGDGSTALIGALATPSGNNVGAAYLYTESNGAWPGNPTASFTDPLGTTGDSFGNSVALSNNGSTALIGADGTKGSEPCCVGAAYAYIQSHGVWANTPAQSFANPEGATAQSEFGNSVALSSDGTTALIGAQGGGSSAVNAAYVFTQASGIWSSTPAHSFADPTGNAAELFGASITLSANGSIALIGAPSTTVSGGTQDGAAYIFVQTNGTWSNTPAKVLTDPPTAAGDDFGVTVALSGDGSAAFIGAPFTTVSGQQWAGAAYSFASSADLSLALASSPANVNVNGSVTYMLTVTNNDTQVTATSLSLTDTLPAGMTYVSANAAGSTCNNSSGTVTCTLASLAPSATWQPSITVTATTAGSIQDTATVSGSQPDPNTANNTASVTTGVTASPPPPPSGGGGGGGGGAFGMLSLLLLAPLARQRKHNA